MKILFKQLSLSYSTGKINDTELALKFDRIVKEAFANEIIIWHVGKKMVLTESDFDYYVNLQNMTINWAVMVVAFPKKSCSIISIFNTLVMR